MGPEKKFRRKVEPLLRAIPLSFWESIEQKGKKGTPDMFGCIDSIFIAIEFKASGGVVTELQAMKLKKIQRANGVGIVLTPDNFDEMYSLLLNLAKSRMEHDSHLEANQ